MRRIFVVAVASAVVVGIATGVLLHNEFGSSRALARPALPALYGQATWKSGEVKAPLFRLRDQRGASRAPRDPPRPAGRAGVHGFPLYVRVPD